MSINQSFILNKINSKQNYTNIQIIVKFKCSNLQQYHSQNWYLFKERRVSVSRRMQTQFQLFQKTSNKLADQQKNVAQEQKQLQEKVQNDQHNRQAKNIRNSRNKLQQRLILRGFKSLNRKNVHSPALNTFNHLNQQNNSNSNNINYTNDSKNAKTASKITLYTNKQNIKDMLNINPANNENNNDNISTQPRQTNNSTSKQAEKERKKSNGLRYLQAKNGSLITNRSSSKNKQRNKQNQKQKQLEKGKLEVVEKTKQKEKKIEYFNQNSPNTNIDSKQYGFLKPINNKIIIGSNKKQYQQIVVLLNPNLCKSPIRQQNQQIYVSSSPSTQNILCESVSKDGNYRVLSRALNVDQLKQAVDLEHNINLKSKKQAIKQLQQMNQLKNVHQGAINVSAFSTVSPRFASNSSNGPKYTLDPSKISNKQNGNIKAYSVNSNQGISRKYNEDRVSIILNIMKNGVKASFFAIYDGHGGANCCDFLTQNLHQYIFNSQHFPSQPRQALIQGMKIAQSKYIEIVKKNYEQKKQLDRSGSCAIILLIVGDDCYIANLGDSRAVLSTCMGKPMYSLSRDHKPTDSGQQTRIIKQGGKIYRTQMFRNKKQQMPLTVQPNINNSTRNNEVRQHSNSQMVLKHGSPLNLQQQTNTMAQVVLGPLRVFPGKLSVTRTFGDIQAKQPQFGGIRNCISSDPEICKYTLCGKEDFIMLGCDGVFQRLDSQQVIQQAWRSIRSYKSSNAKSNKNKDINTHDMAGIAAQSVVKLCMDRKSTDNITVIMVCFSSLGLESSLSDYASV